MCACGDGWSRSKRPLEFYPPPLHQMRNILIKSNKNHSYGHKYELIATTLLINILICVFVTETNNKD